MSDFTRENQESQNDVPEYVQEVYREFQKSNIGGGPEQGAAPCDLNAVNSGSQAPQGSAPHDCSAANHASQPEQGKDSRSFNGSNTRAEDEASTQGDVPKARKKKWLPFAISGAAVTIIVVILVIVLLPSMMIKDEQPAALSQAKIWTDVEGGLHKLEEDGTYSVMFAEDSANHAVGWSQDGTYVLYTKNADKGLYCNSFDGGKEVPLGNKENTVEPVLIIQQGVYYSEIDSNSQKAGLYFYQFNTEKTIQLAENYITYYFNIPYGSELFFINDAKEVMIFVPEEGFPRSIGKLDSIENAENLYILNASNDGELVFLVQSEETADNIYTVRYYCLDTGQLELLGILEDYKYSGGMVDLNQAQTGGLIRSPESDILFYKAAGKPVEEFSIDGKPVWDVWMDDSPSVEGQKEYQLRDAFYCTTYDADSFTKTLYYVDENGEINQLISDIYPDSDIKIGDKTIVFVRSNKDYSFDLCYCPLNGDGIGETVAISKSAFEFQVSVNEEYIYYESGSDIETRMAILYVYDIKNDKKETIDTQVNDSTFRISEDGKTVVYLKNTKELYADASEYVGEAYLKNLGEEPVKLASDVTWFYASRPGKYIQGDMIPFMANVYVKNSASENPEMMGELYLYDGVEIKKLAEDVDLVKNDFYYDVDHNNEIISLLYMISQIKSLLE